LHKLASVNIYTTECVHLCPHERSQSVRPLNHKRCSTDHNP